METPMKRAALFLMTAALIASSCGSGDDAATEPVAAATDSTLASADPGTDAPTTTAAPTAAEETTTTERTGPLLDDEGNEITVLHPEAMPVLELAALSAGPISFTPTLCSVTGFDMVSFGGVEGFTIAGDRFFLGGEPGVVGLALDEAATAAGECSLVADESLAPGGVLLPDDTYDRLSGTAEGRVIASSVFGSHVFDTHLGQSFECDGMGGEVRVSSDGTTGYAYWVGPEVETWAISDSICTQGETVTYSSFDGVSHITAVGTDLYVGGRDLEGVNGLSLVQNGAPTWRLGSDDPSDPDWWAGVEGVVPCGPNMCVTEWFGTFNVIDPSGAVIAHFDSGDDLGVRGITKMAATSDGTLYVLASDLFDHEFDGRTWFDWIIRLEPNG